MTTDYQAYHKHLEERPAELGREQRAPMSGFARPACRLDEEKGRALFSE